MGRQYSVLSGCMSITGRSEVCKCLLSDNGLGAGETIFFNGRDVGVRPQTSKSASTKAPAKPLMILQSCVTSDWGLIPREMEEIPTEWPTSSFEFTM